MNNIQSIRMQWFALTDMHWKCSFNMAAFLPWSQYDINSRIVKDLMQRMSDASFKRNE